MNLLRVTLDGMRRPLPSPITTTTHLYSSPRSISNHVPHLAPRCPFRRAANALAPSNDPSPTIKAFPIVTSRHAGTYIVIVSVSPSIPAPYLRDMHTPIGLLTMQTIDAATSGTLPLLSLPRRACLVWWYEHGAGIEPWLSSTWDFSHLGSSSLVTIKILSGHPDWWLNVTVRIRTSMYCNWEALFGR